MLKMCKTSSRKMNWSKLRNPQLQKMYSITVCNLFAQLSWESNDVDNEYSKFLQFNDEGAEKLIPECKKKVSC